MLVQVYPIQSVCEAIKCVEVGADIIGFVVDCNETDDKFGFEINETTAIKIVEALRDKAETVMMCNTLSTKTLIEKIEKIRPNYVQFSLALKCSEELYKNIKTIDTKIKVIESIAVKNEQSIRDAIIVSKRCDIIMLDSPSNGSHSGATGMTHSRLIDKMIINEIKIPYILAGGLGPDNLLNAIKDMDPFAVDTLTKTSLIENGVHRKDISKLQIFCDIAHSNNRN